MYYRHCTSLFGLPFSLHFLQCSYIFMRSEKRRESGFSQEELGLKIGKSSNAVSRYENAENTMDVHTFAKTVNALKASPYELLKDLEVPEPDSKIVSLFFQIQRLDKNKKKFALSMVESMLDNLAGL